MSSLSFNQVNTRFCRGPIKKLMSLKEWQSVLWTIVSFSFSIDRSVQRVCTNQLALPINILIPVILCLLSKSSHGWVVYNQTLSYVCQTNAFSIVLICIFSQETQIGELSSEFTIPTHVVTLCRSFPGVDFVDTGRCTTVTIEPKHLFGSTKKLTQEISSPIARSTCEFLGTSFKHILWFSTLVLFQVSSWIGWSKALDVCAQIGLSQFQWCHSYSGVLILFSETRYTG